jgi:hypothetical protein
VHQFKDRQNREHGGGGRWLSRFWQESSLEIKLPLIIALLPPINPIILTQKSLVIKFFRAGSTENKQKLAPSLYKCLLEI